MSEMFRHDVSGSLVDRFLHCKPNMGSLETGSKFQELIVINDVWLAFLRCFSEQNNRKKLFRELIGVIEFRSKKQIFVKFFNL